MTDPASGVLATANSRITPDSYPYQISVDWELAYSNERIYRAIGSRSSLTPADMTKLQNDTYSALDKTIAERVAYAVDHSAASSKRAKAAAERLRKWNGRVDLNEPEANITQAVRIALLPMLLESKLGKSWELYTWRSRSYALELLLEHQPARWLPSGYPDWNGFLTAALERGLKESGAPSKLSDWTWAKNHSTHLTHPVFGKTWYLRWFAGRTGPDAKPLPGNAYTVRVNAGVHGASERFVTDLAVPDQTTMTLPMGESGNIRSEWYADQWLAWAQGLPLHLPFGANTGTGVSANRSLTLSPQ